MNEKVILILVDGMRADSLKVCKNEFINEFISKSECSMTAQTVMPSVTLPCHMSLFLSVTPQRHGILTNTYVPQVRPIEDLFSRLKKADKTTASFYNWEELRDISSTGSLDMSYFLSMSKNKNSDNLLTSQMLKYVGDNKTDFVFLYLGSTDSIGHRCGFMSDEYLATVSNAWDCIEDVYNNFRDEYTIMVTADHGGHDFMHGMDILEDMTIPIIINSKRNIKVGEDASILNIAPTIADLMGVSPADEWRGKSFI